MRIALRLAALPVALILAAGLGSALDLDITHITPRPQPPLLVINEESLKQLREDFNAFKDRPRVLAKLSPT